MKKIIIFSMAVLLSVLPCFSSQSIFEKKIIKRFYYFIDSRVVFVVLPCEDRIYFYLRMKI